MPVSPGSIQFQYLYEIAPITLLGGVAGQLPGGAMSILSFTQGSNASAITGPMGGVSLDKFFAKFVPLPGASLIDNEIGSYPFANQQTAANAIITKPLVISYQMICPAAAPGGFAQKQALIMALQQALMQHNLNGGLYGCATPAFYWDNCVMTGMRDITPTNQTQRQVIWQLDFVKPLVTTSDAQQQYNTLLSKISSGTQLQPNSSGALPISGVTPGVGDPGSGQSSAVSPPVSGPGLGISNTRVDIGSVSIGDPIN